MLLLLLHNIISGEIVQIKGCKLCLIKYTGLLKIYTSIVNELGMNDGL